ncbi:MAG: hypothetical protein RLZZ65_592 [Bacteroidota bacterium]
MSIELTAFWTALKGYVQQGAFYHGAALAYYTLFAFIPMIYLTTSIYGRIVGAANMRSIVTELLQNGLGLTDPKSILHLVDGMSFEKPSFLMELISIGVLLFTCSAFMLSLKRSLNEFFNVIKKNRHESNLFMEIIGFRFLGVVLLAGIAFVIILFYFVQVFVFSAIHSWIHWQSGFFNFSLELLQIAFTILTNILVFSLIFKYLHDAKVSWKLALNGAFVTAILLYLSQWILGYYLQHFFLLGQLGIANSIFMMLAWVHYSAQIVFFGAKFTYQLGKDLGDRISS